MEFNHLVSISFSPLSCSVSLLVPDLELLSMVVLEFEVSAIYCRNFVLLSLCSSMAHA